jgi:nucleoside-diphosphate-sugar epimerase
MSLQTVRRGPVVAIRGTPYNICDDIPVLFADYLRAVVEALGTPRPRRLPAGLGRLLFGEVGRYIFRSLRVSNRRFKEAAGWAPEVRSILEGWPRIAAEWRVPTSAAAGG